MAVAAPIIAAAIAPGIQGMLIRFALSLAVSYLTQKLFAPDMPGQDSNSGSSKDPGVKQRIPSDPSNKLPVIYGEDKIHGSIVFADISSDNKTMAFIIALCEGPVYEIGTLSWDDYDLTVDATTHKVVNATHADGGTDGWLNGNLKVIKYPYGGRCTQMETFSSKWASNGQNRSMPDVAYAYLELNYDRANQVTGLTSKLGFQIKGKLVRQINTSSSVAALEGLKPVGQTGYAVVNPAAFDDNLYFSDFSGNQIHYWVNNYNGGFTTAFNKGDTKFATNGTIEIIDLGPASDPSAPADLNAYKSGTAAVGAGTGAMVAFDYVELGEQHVYSHTANVSSPHIEVGDPYTDGNGIYHADSGKRKINGLRITSWGNNYTSSVNMNTPGNDETRVWIKYTWFDVTTQTTEVDYWVLTTWQIRGPQNATFSKTEADYSIELKEKLNHSVLCGGGNFSENSWPMNSYGARRPFANPYLDTYNPDKTYYYGNGDAITFPYASHQQYFTAPVPGIVLQMEKGIYSSNPAECLVDYLTNKIYGCGLSIIDSDLELQSFGDHKDFCDEVVTHNDPDGNSVTSKRYECNGYANTNDTKDLTISDITMNSQSIFGYTLGKFQMISDTVKSTTNARGQNDYDFDKQSTYGDITVINDGFNSTLNELNLQFKSKLNKFQDDQVFLEYSNKYFNEPVLSKDLTFKFINSSVQAQRLGTVLMNKSRNNKIVSFKTDSRARHLQVNDVVNINDTFYDLGLGRVTKNFYDRTTGSSTDLDEPRPTLRIYDDNQTNGKFKRFESPELPGEPVLIYLPRIGNNSEVGYGLLEFFTKCIYGQLDNMDGEFTVDELKANNRLGDYLSFVSMEPVGSTGADFTFYWKKIIKHGYGTDYDGYRHAYNQPELGIIADQNEAHSTWNATVEIQEQQLTGGKFRINSISEVALEGGVQGYYVTAQEYKAEDYTVGTLTSRPEAPAITGTHTYSAVGVVSNLTLVSTDPNASAPYVEISLDMPATGNTENIEVYFAGSSTTAENDRILTAAFTANTGSYAAGSTHTFNVEGIPTTTDLYIWVRASNSSTRGLFSSSLSVGAWDPVNASTNVGNDSVGPDSIQDGAVDSDALANTLDFTSKTITLPADAVKAHTGTWDSTIKTADFTIINQAYWLGYFIDTTSNTVTITLPAAPDDGDIIKLIDVGANAATNNIIINGNSNNIQGSSSNYNISTNRSGTEFIFLTGNGWVLTNN